MVDWQSPQVLEVCLEVTDRLNLYMAGVYTWHFLTTLRYVELPLLTGKLAWRWTYIYYLAARYLLIVQLPLHEVKQRVVFEVLAITGCMVTTLASGNLLFRTIAVWNGHRPVVAFLILLEVGHWAMVFAVALPPIVASGGRFVPTNGKPTTIKSNMTIPFFLYSFLLDVIILVLTIVGLVRQRAARSTKLWKSLYRQGVVYFVATAIINLPTLFFAWNVQSGCLLGVFSVPGLVTTVMASSRAVTALLELPPADESRPMTMQTRPNLDVSAYRSDRLTTNINLTLPFQRSAFESEETESQAGAHQHDTESQGESGVPQFVLDLHEDTKE